MIPYPAGEPLTCQQIRELDVLAIEHVGIPGLVLMENAARAAAEFIYATMIEPKRSPTVILCGGGNNGGDGFVIARHLHNAGVPVTVVLATEPERLVGDARVNYEILTRMRVRLVDYRAAGQVADAAILSAEVVVDALLGTGATGEPRGASAELIRRANAAPRARRVAIDIPSGLDADAGTVHEPCLCADATVTFVAAKPGFSTPAAREKLGRVVVVDIGVPRELIPGRGEGETRVG